MAKLTVDLRIRDAGFAKSMTRASKKSADFGTRIKKADKASRSFGSALKGLANPLGKLAKSFAGPGFALLIGGGIAAGLGKIASTAIAAGRAMARTADQLGIGTDVLAQLDYAAQQAGTGLDSMSGPLRDMRKALASGEIGSALAGIGMSAADLAGMDAAQQFAAISDAIAGTADPAARARAAMALFGSDAGKLMPLLMRGAAGLEEFRRQADELGVGLGRVDTGKLELAGMAMDRVRAALTNIGNQIGVILAPLFEFIGQQASQIAAKIGEWAEGLRANNFAGLLDIMVSVAQVVQYTLADAMTGASMVVDFLINGFNKIRYLLLSAIDQALTALAGLDIIPQDLLNSIGKATQEAYRDSRRGSQIGGAIRQGADIIRGFDVDSFIRGSVGSYLNDFDRRAEEYAKKQVDGSMAIVASNEELRRSVEKLANALGSGVFGQSFNTASTVRSGMQSTRATGPRKF